MTDRQLNRMTEIISITAIIIAIIAFIISMNVIANKSESQSKENESGKSRAVKSTVALDYVYTQPDPVPLWIEVGELGTLRITVYGPSRDGIHRFPATNPVSRWFGRTRDDTGFTVADALIWAEELGLDGICAASPGDYGLYSRHRDDMPAMIEVEGHGRYLVVDRTASFLWNVIDLWVPDPYPGGTYFAEYCSVKEIVPNPVEVEDDTYGYF